MAKRLSYWLVGLVLVGALVGIVFFLRLRQPKFTSVMATIDAARTKGPKEAAVEIVEYSDFQCSACQRVQPLLNEFLNQGNIRLVFKHFPLPGHRWSFLAHQAAECAAQQDAFWSYHDRLYQDQTIWGISLGLPLETFMRYAQEQGLNLDRFSNCLADEQVVNRINEEKLTGTGLGVRSTPSFFVNGKLVVGGPALKEEVGKLLAEKSSA